MSIQINYHSLLDLLWISLEQEADGQRDVSVGTETSAFLCMAVMEAAADIDRPTSLLGQLAALYR